jgi:predicted transcriptional regulator
MTNVYFYVIRFVIRYEMPLVSIRLPEEIEAQLAREAERVQRPKSEIAREAIVDYLQRLERERFLAEIARAARERGDAEALTTAEEALPFDNETLALSEGGAVHEPRTFYPGKKKTKKRR